MKTKACSRCKEPKKISLFGIRNRKRHKICRACCAASVRKTYENREGYRDSHAANKRSRSIEKHKLILDYLKLHPCVDCGEDDPLVLEFDHVIGTKMQCVTSLMLYSDEKMNNEIAKCEIRCANCHTKETAKRANTIRYQMLQGELSGQAQEVR